MCLLTGHQDQALHDREGFTVCPDCKSFTIMKSITEWRRQAVARERKWVSRATE
jgi:hypothetical protein